MGVKKSLKAPEWGPFRADMAQEKSKAVKIWTARKGAERWYVSDIDRPDSAGTMTRRQAEDLARARNAEDADAMAHCVSPEHESNTVLWLALSRMAPSDLLAWTERQAAVVPDELDENGGVAHYIWRMRRWGANGMASEAVKVANVAADAVGYAACWKDTKVSRGNAVGDAAAGAWLSDALLAAKTADIAAK